MQLLNNESADIVNFSLRSSVGKFKTIFGGFQERRGKRQLEKSNGGIYQRRIPTGIDSLDAITGGMEKSQSDILIARSGSGKTTYLLMRAIHACRMGYKVLFVSAEDSESRLLAKFDSAWTSLSFKDVRSDNISGELEKKLEKIYNDILLKKSDISVVAFEKFDTASIKDIRELILEYIKIHGSPPDLVCADYLEKFDPGTGKRYSSSTDGEKLRRQSVAEKMTNLAIEFDLCFATASQTGDLSPDQYNRENFVITRHNSSGDRNLANSFSLFLTLNVTKDEYNNNTARLYIDKLRDSKGGQIIKICTAFNHSRFYDRRRSLELFEIEE